MSRKKFIESHGATCKNWNWSWSFINDAEKFIIFGAWDVYDDGNMSQILARIGKSVAKEISSLVTLNHVNTFV